MPFRRIFQTVIFFNQLRRIAKTHW